MSYLFLFATTPFPTRSFYFISENIKSLPNQLRLGTDIYFTL